MLHFSHSLNDNVISSMLVCQQSIFLYYLMDQIHRFFFGNTTVHYVQAGFTDVQAEAMAWIADQRPKGKYWGFITGSFLAVAWGHWHYRIFAHLGLRCSKIYTQLAILGSCVAFGDYITSGKRYGANEYVANNLYLNNNLFFANITSLIQKFQVLNRKFTSEQVKTFNQRVKAMRSNIPIEQRKWIFNPNIESQQEFQRRRKLNLNAPWQDHQIRDAIKAQDIHKKQQILYGPSELYKLIDQTGQKLGIVRDFNFGWRPLYPQQH